MNLFSLADDLGRRWPAAGRPLMNLLVRRLVPMTRHLGLRLLDQGDHLAELGLPLDGRTRNHVGSVYFGAQTTLAEITMGLMLFRIYPPGPFGVLVKRAEFEFLRKAKSALRARCEPDEALFEGLARDLAATGKAEAWVSVSLLDTDGQEVTRARFLAAVKDFGWKAPATATESPDGAP